jgi:hypothetical protein
MIEKKQTVVTPLKMVLLILDSKSCGVTVRIDVAADVHVEVSHAICIGVTHS